VEGSWTLIGTTRITGQTFGDKDNMEGWPGDKASAEALKLAMQMDLKDPQLARAAKVTGERVKQGDAVRLRLVEVYGDQSKSELPS